MRVALATLHAHPANPNEMSPELFEKLKRNIQREGRYPPLIARLHPDLPGQWQLLDGEHRKYALEALGYTEAVVFPWQCDDATALRLLATFNRLTGEDVPAKRSELLALLAALMPHDELALLLPEDASGIHDALALLDFDEGRLLAELEAAAATEAAAAPRLLSFAVLPEDEDAIESALARAMDTFDGTNRRGRALALICRSYECGDTEEASHG